MEYDFGLRLRELRDSKGLTQVQVGKRIGVTSKTISGYEHNTITPPIDALKKLALLFGVSADYLLGLEDHKSILLNFDSQRKEDTVEQIVNLIRDNFS